MNNLNVKNTGLTVLSVGLSCVLLSACATTRQTTIEEVTTTGPNCMEMHTTQIKSKNGKLKIKEQKYYEKIKCVNKRGKNIKSDSPEQCLEKGGRIVDKVITQETEKKY